MKKFGFYFKKGFVLVKMAMKGKSFFTKLLLGLYLILSFLGKMLFFLRPIFLIADNNLDIKAKYFAYPDQFIEHGSVDELDKKYKQDMDTIYKSIIKMTKEKND